MYINIHKATESIIEFFTCLEKYWWEEESLPMHERPNPYTAYPVKFVKIVQLDWLSFFSCFPRNEVCHPTE